MSANVDEELSEAVLRKIERNNENARKLRKSKVISHPYSNGAVISNDTKTIKMGATKYKDTGGGFLIEETPEETDTIDALLAHVEMPIFEPDRPSCQKCLKPFAVSWLFDNFDFRCCDSCKDPEVHKLISKTDAKQLYLLKDCDLDKREPKLKFITKKNPHNVRWGEMKLYLQVQVEERALEVWGSIEKIDEEKELREEKKVISKAKKYEKNIKELRKGMRSSLYDRTTSATHSHQWGPETYDEEEDVYHRKCITCPYEESFEKM